MSHAFVALPLRVRSFYLPSRMVLAAGLLGYGLNTREGEPVQCVIAFSLVDETITLIGSVSVPVLTWIPVPAFCGPITHMQKPLP